MGKKERSAALRLTSKPSIRIKIIDAMFTNQRIKVLVVVKKVVKI
jgi:hypothetical protein